MLRRRLQIKMQKNSLFIKLVAIMVAAIIVVCSLTVMFALNASRDAYVSTYAETSQQFLEQVADNISLRNDEIINVIYSIRTSWVFRAYLTNADRSSAEASGVAHELTMSINSILDSYANKKMHLLVVSPTGRSYVSGGAKLLASIDYLIDTDYSLAAKNDPSSIHYTFISEGITDITLGDSAYLAVATLDSETSVFTTAYIYLIIDQDTLRSMYSGFSNNANNLIMMDNDGVIVSSQNDYEIGVTDQNLLKTAKEAESGDVQYVTTTYNGENVSVVSCEASEWGLHIVSVIDRDTVMAIGGTTKPVIVAALIISAIVIVIIFIILRRTTRPLHLLVERLLQVTQGNFSDVLPVTGGYEVRSLTNAYNFMLRDLEEYVDKLIQTENERRSAEISALQMQINPHFINNTLASIKWLIWQNQMEKASGAIDSFTILLRNTIGNNEEMISLKSEVENLKHYTFLQNIRFGDRISVSFMVDDSCLDVMVPKLILQPILENAFFHAYPDNHKGNVSVFVSSMGDKVIAEIIDDGVGMVGESGLSDKNHFSGIGLHNVEERIKIIFGDEYGITVASEKNQGTSVRITIPGKSLTSKNFNNLQK